MINAWEIVLFITLISFCLIFRKNQLGLLGTFIFVFYSGMMAYKSIINPSLMGLWGLYVYIFSGFFVVGSVMLGFKKQDQIISR